MQTYCFRFLFHICNCNHFVQDGNINHAVTRPDFPTGSGGCSLPSPGALRIVFFVLFCFVFFFSFHCFFIVFVFFVFPFFLCSLLLYFHLLLFLFFFEFLCSFSLCFSSFFLTQFGNFLFFLFLVLCLSHLLLFLFSLLLLPPLWGPSLAGSQHLSRNKKESLSLCFSCFSLSRFFCVFACCCLSICHKNNMFSICLHLFFNTSQCCFHFVIFF